MIDLSRVEKYYVACGLRICAGGIDGLAAIVSQQYGRDLSEDSLFLFCGRRTDRIKALYYSGDGYILLYKRLNNGAFQWPRTEQELRLLDARSFRWLMEGLKIDQPKAIQKEKSEETKIILYFPIILARRFFRVNIFLTIQCLIFPQDSLIDKRCLLLDASGHFEHGSVSNRTGRLGKSRKPA